MYSRELAHRKQSLFYDGLTPGVNALEQLYSWHREKEALEFIQAALEGEIPRNHTYTPTPPTALVHPGINTLLHQQPWYTQESYTLLRQQPWYTQESYTLLCQQPWYTQESTPYSASSIGTPRNQHPTLPAALVHPGINTLLRQQPWYTAAPTFPVFLLLEGRDCSARRQDTSLVRITLNLLL